MALHLPPFPSDTRVREWGKQQRYSLEPRQRRTLQPPKLIVHPWAQHRPFEGELTERTGRCIICFHSFPNLQHVCRKVRTAVAEID